jgi:hypothetical protein
MGQSRLLAGQTQRRNTKSAKGCRAPKSQRTMVWRIKLAMELLFHKFIVA